MSKRDFTLPETMDFEFGGQTLRITPITGNEVRIEHGPGGVNIRGVRVEAAESYTLVDGDWRGYYERPDVRFSLTVRPYGTMRDGTPAQAKAVNSLYRQAAAAFAEAHPRLLAEAQVREANNALYRTEGEVAKAEKVLNDLLDQRRVQLAAEAAAKARLDAMGPEEGVAPRM